jgi:hypothetical protein
MRQSLMQRQQTALPEAIANLAIQRGCLTTQVQLTLECGIEDPRYFSMILQVHSKGRKMPKEASQAGDWLIALYGSMLNTSRWQRSNGADFVFYDPHPGFTDGSAEQLYYKLLCDDFQHAMHIVVERGQRNICQVACRCLSL